MRGTQHVSSTPATMCGCIERESLERKKPFGNVRCTSEGSKDGMLGVLAGESLDAKEKPPRDVRYDAAQS